MRPPNTTAPTNTAIKQRITLFGYEFRASIYKNLNTDIYEACISVDYNLLTEDFNLIHYFRSCDDKATTTIERSHNVNISFNSNNGRIIIRTRNINDKVTLTNAIGAIIAQFRYDMNYAWENQKIEKKVRPITKKITFPTTSVSLAQGARKAYVAHPAHTQVIAAQNAFPGLVMVIHNPTPEMVTRFYNDKIIYSFLPEFIIKIPQLPPPTFISPPPQLAVSHQSPREPGEVV